MKPEPPPRRDAGLRADDARRESVAEHLNDHYVRGSLDAEERDRRVGLALSARTCGELDDLIADLEPRATPVSDKVAPRVPVRTAVGAVWAVFALALGTVVALTVLILLGVAVFG